MKRCVLVLAISFAGCASVDETGGERGDLGKADLYGSCQAASSCGDQAPGGTCWCDDSCIAHGDCCSDKGSVCPGGVMFATYNAGLAHGAVPYADERVQPIVAALKQSPADVLCLQEVWTDDDAKAIQEGVAETFPHAFREKTENDSSEWFACGITQWKKLFTMNSCVSEKCKPNGISAFECAADQCKSEWNALEDRCKLCLSANTTSPFSCAAWRAPMFANDGRNGLLVLSREPMEDAKYTPFETYVIKRGVITAEVKGFDVQCTHMTAQLDVVPYPTGGSFASWRDEHQAQVTKMAAMAGSRKRTVLLGDLNTGPAGTGIDAELPDNFESLLDAGYRDTNTASPVCTFCDENPLVCSKPEGCGPSTRIDHVLLKNFPQDVKLDFERFNDQPIPSYSRLSDHYGLQATMPY